MDSCKIPIVHLSSCYHFGDSQEAVDQPIEAFRNFDCAYVRNHGIPRNQVGCSAVFNGSAQSIRTVVYLYVNLLDLLLAHIGVSDLSPVTYEQFIYKNLSMSIQRLVYIVTCHICGVERSSKLSEDFSRPNQTKQYSIGSNWKYPYLHYRENFKSVSVMRFREIPSAFTNMFQL